ncbi:MAG: thioredoxin [Selenomonadaceae bacterium]|nr:thioredoxin [Selenomonadaceae bacterium]
MNEYWRRRCQVATFIVAAGFIVYGVSRDEITLIFNKAIRICMECIGLG